METMRSEKPIRAPPHFSDVSPMLPSKQLTFLQFSLAVSVHGRTATFLSLSLAVSVHCRTASSYCIWLSFSFCVVCLNVWFLSLCSYWHCPVCVSFASFVPSVCRTTRAVTGWSSVWTEVTRGSVPTGQPGTSSRPRAHRQ